MYHVSMYTWHQFLDNEAHCLRGLAMCAQGRGGEHGRNRNGNGKCEETYRFESQVQVKGQECIASVVDSFL